VLASRARSASGSALKATALCRSATFSAELRYRVNPRARDRHCTVLPGCPFVAEAAARVPLLHRTPPSPEEKPDSAATAPGALLAFRKGKPWLCATSAPEMPSFSAARSRALVLDRSNSKAPGG
jgi:hypothetical protein